MFKLTAAIIIIATLYLIWYCWYYSIYNVSKVYSTIDNEPYYVHNAHPDKQDAADYLSDISITVHKVLSRVIKSYDNSISIGHIRLIFLLFYTFYWKNNINS